MTLAPANPPNDIVTDDPNQNKSRSNSLSILGFKLGSSKHLTLLGHILITTSLVAVISISYFSLNLYASNKAKQWLKGQVEFTPSLAAINIKETEKVRINEQLKVVNFQIARYSEIMVFFSNHYYTSIVLTSTSALVAALCLFLISRIGWKEAHNSLINIFLVACSAVIFFGDLPGNFQEEENFKAYGNLYLEHIALRNEILSYLATGGTVLGVNPQSPDEVSKMNANKFIHYVDRKLAQLNKIPIGFDATGINDIGGIATRFNSTIQPSAAPQ